MSCALVKLTSRLELEVVRLATVGVKANPIIATTKAAMITPVVILPLAILDQEHIDGYGYKC